MTAIRIDRDVLWEFIRQMDRETLFPMLNDAFELLPDDQLLELVSGYLDANKLQQNRAPETDLLKSVQKFAEASLAGTYYEGFNVNSRNFTVQSGGTIAWIDKFNRLLKKCIVQAGIDDPELVCQAFNTLFHLLDQIDECRENIIFFADEAGSWQVGVDWDQALPPWFKLLSATTEAEEYMERVLLMIGNHCRYHKDKFLPLALEAATAAQRTVMARAISSGFDNEFRQLQAKLLAAQKAQREKLATEARLHHLTSLIGQESKIWLEIEALIMSRNHRSYTEAVNLLLDLKALETISPKGDFETRLLQIRLANAGKRSLMRSLDRAGLRTPDPKGQAEQGSS